MPEQFSPVSMANGAGVPLDADYFNRLEAALETADDRATGLERGLASPVTVSYAATITPNAAEGALFRCTATGSLTLNDPVNGGDGQTIALEIFASGADRTLSFAGSGATPVTIPSGQWWRGTLTYHAADTAWVLAD